MIPNGVMIPIMEGLLKRSPQGITSEYRVGENKFFRSCGITNHHPSADPKPKWRGATANEAVHTVQFCGPEERRQGPIIRSDWLPEAGV